VVDRLRDAEDARWVEFDRGIGDHRLSSVLTELGRMAGVGLLELNPANGRSARLPTSD